MVCLYPLRAKGPKVVLVVSLYPRLILVYPSVSLKLYKLTSSHTSPFIFCRVPLVLNREVIHHPFHPQVDSRRLSKKATRVVFHCPLKNTCQAISFLRLNPNCRQPCAHARPCAYPCAPTVRLSPILTSAFLHHNTLSFLP